jgi:hypothetical protein
MLFIELITNNKGEYEILIPKNAVIINPKGGIDKKLNTHIEFDNSNKIYGIYKNYEKYKRKTLDIFIIGNDIKLMTHKMQPSLSTLSALLGKGIAVGADDGAAGWDWFEYLNKTK